MLENIRCFLMDLNKKKDTSSHKKKYQKVRRTELDQVEKRLLAVPITEHWDPVLVTSVIELSRLQLCVSLIT